MLDETFILETPPLTSCYCRIGEQRRVPITGNRNKRVLHGALNICSGDTLLWVRGMEPRGTSGLPASDPIALARLAHSSV